MKPFNNLITLIVISCLVLSPCLCYLTLGRNRTNNIQCIDSERDALLQFKHGVISNDCGLTDQWRSHTNCCRWPGVVCSNLTNHVVKLSLGGSFGDPCWSILGGTVSHSLGELTHLEYLNLSFNEFHGKIPHQLGNLSKLTTLDLSNNVFDGKIPHQLGNLSKLTTLDLGYAFNYSDNTVVQSLSWVSRLTLLRYLDLSLANLSKIRNWITIVNNLPSLRVLSMNFCQLSTEIPLSISYVNSSTTLQSISLSESFFKDDSIFQWLFNLPRITTQLVLLDLSDNNFQVPIPSEFENFHNLSYLDLSGNGFQGSVSKIISKLCNLEKLYLGNNSFTDEISNVIHSLVNCNNKALLGLYLGYNRFWGKIPHDIGSLSSLMELDVSSNSLEGTLPRTFFFGLVSLRQLSLSDNPRLEINTQEDWIPPFKLDIIQLRSCKLGPRFPKWLQLQSNFSYFDVSNSGISDSIPISFWNSLSPNLQYLNMSNNQFYGMLPNLPQWRKPFFSNDFATIDLSSNLFEGVIPSGFANTLFLFLNDNKFTNCSNILCPKTRSISQVLDLSNNLFSGELPDCWMNFSQLTSLHLENNRFSGSMPKSISTLSSLQFLHLYNNSFSGQFPVAFANLTSLVILNLGYNSFSGNIPSWIGNAFQRLGALILRENHFTGEIPESICQLNSSQILDLASNHLSGVLPHCIDNFTAMKGIKNLQLEYELDDGLPFTSPYVTENRIETVIVFWKREEQRFKETIRFVKYIDLSSNELSGEIPDGISSLTALGSIDLSKNNLSGYIPLEIGNLIALEVLDLSNNHLSGEIPISLAKLTTLDVMNVSNNNLSGEIPVSTQLQSFDASSYAGNPWLCGAPLPSCSKDRVPSNVPNGDNTSVQNKDDDFVFLLGLYISVVLGFIVGFWAVCGTLVIKTSWRHAYFRLVDNIKDKIL